ncbi:MAG: PRD domain-containing protein [Lacrimispora sp.]|uniref:PRD domain-containing protein n=1 Tax=Lacrimispora sp. TaxID=2719234 RepID=UPI0039E36009
MKVIKKINNNVALCLDSQNRELVAFGNGIGFPAIPYEVSLDKISMTFYQVNSHYLELLNSIPEDVFEIASQAVIVALKNLNRQLNPNLAFNLADHIHFAIIRQKTFREMKFPLSFELETFYPKETELAKLVLQLIKKRLKIILPKSEISLIAMHFVNAQNESQIIEESDNVETLIEAIKQEMESFLKIKIDEESINYNRFILHVRYFLKRVEDNNQVQEDNSAILAVLRNDVPLVYDCACNISKIVESNAGIPISENELVYLMIHMNRIYQNTLLTN